jgi:predicted phosphate transport protein (TIGR00153 family)
MSLTRDKQFWDAFVSHAELTAKASKLARELFGSPGQGEEFSREIHVMERKADKIVHDTVLLLHQTWITPLDREEIHQLLTSLDDILDNVDGASTLFHAYQVKVMRPEARELGEKLVVAVDELKKVIEMLPKMKDARPIIDLCHQVDQHEHEGDLVYRAALAKLLNDGTDAIEVIKWRDILTRLEDALDCAKDAARIVEGIALEHA